MNLPQASLVRWYEKKYHLPIREYDLNCTGSSLSHNVAVVAEMASNLCTMCVNPLGFLRRLN